MLRMTTTRGGGGERRGKFRMGLFVEMAMTHDVMTKILVKKLTKALKVQECHNVGFSKGRPPSKGSVIDNLLDLRDNLDSEKYLRLFNKMTNYWGGKYAEDNALKLWEKHGKKTVAQKTIMVRVFFRWTCLYPENVTIRPKLSHYLLSKSKLQEKIQKKDMPL